MPDLTVVRPCAVIVLLAAASCGQAPMLDVAGELFPIDEPLTISGQVLDGEGRPLWGVEVTAVDQRSGIPSAIDIDFGDPSYVELRQDHSDPYGHYEIELDAEGPTWLHFGAGERTFAWVELNAGMQRELDVVLAEDDIVSCQLYTAEGQSTISSYSWWAHASHWGRGAGGGCMTSHGGGCGPEALTFVWPGGFDTVEVRLGDAELVELSGWDEPCEAIE